MHKTYCGKQVHRRLCLSRGDSKILLVFLFAMLLFITRVPPNILVAHAIPYQSQTTESSRTIDFYWHNFFNASMITDVWLARESTYGDVRILSWVYPIVYEWISLEGATLPDGKPNPHPEGSIFYYAPAKLQVTGENLPEINITRPEFVPHNLTGGLSQIVAGGNANLSYYMQYITIERATQLKIYTPGSYDGYISELNGTITMDRNGTMQILGLTQSQYESLKADPVAWWAVNEGTIETKWQNFLLCEANTRLQIQPMLEYTYTTLSSKVFPGVDLSLQYDALDDHVTLKLDVVAWGNEALLARWFRETFLKSYEYWYSDLNLDVVINSSSSLVNLDTTVDFALYQWSVDNEKYGSGVWCFEPVLGDEVPSIKISGKTYYSKEFPPYIFPNGTYKSYYNVAPSNAWYDQYQPYDYVPSAWNLLNGETLRINYSLPAPVWVLKQNRDSTVTNKTGVLAVPYLEPYPCCFQEQISLDITNKLLTFHGPLNVEEWAKTTFAEDWARLADSEHVDGVLPWGVPYIELILEDEATRDSSIGSVSALPSSATTGDSVEIETILVNLGDLVETINVTAYYNNTAFHEVNNVTLIRHQGSILNFLWNTTGIPSGTYTIKIEASQVPNESNIWNNVNYAVVTLTSAISTTVHDIEVSDVKVSPIVAKAGDLITVEITTSNKGTATESFNVTASYDSKTIGIVSLANVPPGENRSIKFVWDTSTVIPRNYTISAVASSVPNETSIADNTFTYEVITITKLASSLTLDVTPSTIYLGNGSATITGQVSPIKEGIAVTIYFKFAEGNWSTLTNVVTNSNGEYTYTWSPTVAGTYELKAQWLGDVYTEPSESNVHMLSVKGNQQQPPQSPPQSEPHQSSSNTHIFYLLLGGIVCVITPIAFLILKKKKV